MPTLDSQTRSARRASARLCGRYEKGARLRILGTVSIRSVRLRGDELQVRACDLDAPSHAGEVCSERLARDFINSSNLPICR